MGVSGLGFKVRCLGFHFSGLRIQGYVIAQRRPMLEGTGSLAITEDRGILASGETVAQRDLVRLWFAEPNQPNAP